MQTAYLLNLKFINHISTFNTILVMASVPTIALEGGSSESIGDHSIFGVVTVSDRASQGIYDDESGPAIIQFFHEAIKSR